MHKHGNNVIQAMSETRTAEGEGEATGREGSKSKADEEDEREKRAETRNTLRAGEKGVNERAITRGTMFLCILLVGESRRCERVL